MCVTIVFARWAEYPFILVFILAIGMCHAQDLKEPSFEEVMSLHSISNPEISPDGKNVIFQKQTVDWKENRYDRELWIIKDGGIPFQFTNNLQGNSSQARWSPDGQWIAYLANFSDKTQIHMTRLEGGASFQLTNTEQNISGFEWSPDGMQIAFVQAEDKSDQEKKRKDKYGAYAIEDYEYRHLQIWVIGFDPQQLYQTPLPSQLEDSSYIKNQKASILIDSIDFTINDFSWSPDGTKIALEHQPDPLINSFFKADISIYDIATKTLKILVDHPSNDSFEDWSPDGTSILYSSSLDNTTSNYYLNGNVFIISVDGSSNRQIAADYDEDINNLQWNPSGIFGISYQKTMRHILRIDPADGATTILNIAPARIWDYSFSNDGKKMAYTGSGDNDLTEIYTNMWPLGSSTKVTKSSDQITEWKVADSEVISWKSQDGTTIEGILHKPQNFDPQKKYPLMVIIHGGPTGISTPSPTPSYVYPMVQWLNKGALILRPNYRGSAGYGEAFRSLNVKNLGVGDAWDVLSGVEYLVDLGMIDSERISAMGWSQGGYISAFLTTNSRKFKAISVGAGISNWMTYYVNTDIHPFTRQYLKATPWSDKAIYEKTSPMTNINNAVTPTLIQHGEFDKRVPTANAYELFQGLQDMGVETKLIIYKGFGHGITKPKERLAAVWHNWQWFGKYIWNEEIKIPLD